MTRLHTGTIPTSDLAATARVVDGFVTSQTDHQGITGSFTRAYTSTGITQAATDGRVNYGVLAFSDTPQDENPSGLDFQWVWVHNRNTNRINALWQTRSRREVATARP